MNDKLLKKLDILQLKNTKKDWVNKDSTLYAFLKIKEMYILASENLKNKKTKVSWSYQQVKTQNPEQKVLTQETSDKTFDGFSEIRIEQICEQMKDESFKFDRVEKKHIPVAVPETIKTKKLGKKDKPLVYYPKLRPTAKDKIVQEIIRILLQAIWDSPKKPIFKEVSHGFRSGKSTHSALQYVDQQFKNMKWLIEGDIIKTYDTINHEILLKLLEKRIQPGRFLRLIRKLLKAGYLEMDMPPLPCGFIVTPLPCGSRQEDKVTRKKQEIDKYPRTPQKSVVSSILTNIYLHELDVFICKQIEQIEKPEEIIRKAGNLEYEKGKDFLKNQQSLFKELQSKKTPQKALAQIKVDLEWAKKQLLEVTVSLDTQLPVRVKYVRYADNWIVGVDGSITIAKQLKKSIQKFLEDFLKLQLNLEKTKIIHLKSQKAFFLGYTINKNTAVKISIIKKSPLKENLINPKKKAYKKRITKYHLKLEAPIKFLMKKLAEKGFCTNNGFPTSKKPWTVLEDQVIVSNFNGVFLELFGYYSGADNQSALRKIQYILQFSCAMTLGHKHRKKIPYIFRKFGKNLAIPDKKEHNSDKSDNKPSTHFICLKLVDFPRKKTWRVPAT